MKRTHHQLMDNDVEIIDFVSDNIDTNLSQPLVSDKITTELPPPSPQAKYQENKPTDKYSNESESSTQSTLITVEQQSLQPEFWHQPPQQTQQPCCADGEMTSEIDQLYVDLTVNLMTRVPPRKKIKLMIDLLQVFENHIHKETTGMITTTTTIC